MKVYIVMFPQECGYCEPGVEKIFTSKFYADKYCAELNVREKKDKDFEYFVKEFEVEL